MKYGMDMNGVVRTCSSVHIFIVRYILTDCGWVVLHTVMYRCVHSVDGWNGTHIEKVGVWVHFYCNNDMNARHAMPHMPEMKIDAYDMDGSATVPYV